MASAQSHADDEDAEIPLPDECMHLHERGVVMAPLLGVVERGHLQESSIERRVLWCAGCNALVEHALGHVFHVDPGDLRMGFEAALYLLKQGCKVRRAGWEPPPTALPYSAHLVLEQPAGAVRMWVYIMTVVGGVTGYAPQPHYSRSLFGMGGTSAEDILATDWELVPS